MHPTNAPPIGSRYMKVISIVLINVFREWKVVHWKTLILDKEALSSEGSLPTDLDIYLIIAQAAA